MTNAIARVSLGVAIAFGVLALGGEAHALDCGERLVVVGDASVYVRSVCGEPTSLTTRTETRTQYVTQLQGTPPRAIQVALVVSVQVEIWFYDWGPGRFVEELRFENGVLVSERPMGAGTSRGTATDGRPVGATVWHHHRDAHGHRDARRRGDAARSETAPAP